LKNKRKKLAEFSFSLVKFYSGCGAFLPAIVVKGALLRLLDRPRPWMAEAELPWTALLRVQRP
jgi:hypothetical protein